MDKHLVLGRSGEPLTHSSVLHLPVWAYTDTECRRAVSKHRLVTPNSAYTHAPQKQVANLHSKLPRARPPRCRSMFILSHQASRIMAWQAQGHQSFWSIAMCPNPRHLLNSRTSSAKRCECRPVARRIAGDSYLRCHNSENHDPGQAAEPV